MRLQIPTSGILWAAILFGFVGLMSGANAYASDGWPKFPQGESVRVERFANLPASLKQFEFPLNCKDNGLPDSCYRVFTDYYRFDYRSEYAIVTFADIYVRSFVFARHRNKVRKLQFAFRNGSGSFSSIDELGIANINPVAGTLTSFFLGSGACKDGEFNLYTYERLFSDFALTRIAAATCRGSPMKIIWEAK